MSENKRGAIEELSLVAKWKLRKERDKNAELLNSLGWMASAREERNSRAEDFEAVNRRLNELMATPDPIPKDYRDIVLLSQKMGDRKIPSLEEIRRSFYTLAQTAAVVTSAIEKAVKDYPAWAKVNPEYPSQGTPTSGALIEGFGAFLGASVMGTSNGQDEKNEINRFYVLGFEAVLINEKPNSPLLKDVIGWMNEEISSFPEGLRPKIAAAAQKFLM